MNQFKTHPAPQATNYNFGNYVEPFTTYFQPSKSGVYRVNIHGEITCADQFVYAVQALEAANEENGVEISLQCGGGSLPATDMLLHAMRKTDGHIHICATGDCSSAATLILMEADSYELSHNFTSTIHCGSTGFIGNTNEFRAQSVFTNKYMERIMRESYEGFLLPDEIDSMIDGKDIILDAEGWHQRSLLREQYFIKKFEKEEQAALQAPTKPAITKPKRVRKPLNLAAA